MESIQDTNKRGNVEGKVKFIIQRTFFLVVAFMVSMAFIACDKTNPDDDDDGVEKIDTKLVGEWELQGLDGPHDISWYFFNKNGTFEHGCTYFGDRYNGKYSTSGGKVYLKDIEAYRLKSDGTIDVHFEKKDVVLEYKFGTDASGDYLHIYDMSRTGMSNEKTNFTMEGADKFYKQ